MKISIGQWFRRSFSNQCDECLKILEVVLDDEATLKEREFFLKHVDKCSKCYEYFRLETTIRQVIKDKIKPESTPEDLLESIKSAVRQEI